MYLAQLSISNFRKLKEVKIQFQPGLNIIVGANNVGKTAVVDALRALLSGHDEPPPRLDTDDLHRPKDGRAAGDITFHYVFRDLSPDDEADFLAALKPDDNGNLEAHVYVRYSDADASGRLRIKRWCGEHEDVGLSSRHVGEPAGSICSHSGMPRRAFGQAAQANCRDFCRCWPTMRVAMASIRH